MKSCIRFVLVSIAVFLTAAPALAADFSSDVAQTSKAGTVNQKFFVSGEKLRMETASSVAIIRPDKNVMWMLMPHQKMYMEMPIDPSKVPATSEKYQGEIERTLIGKEDVDGRITDKYRIVSTNAGAKTIIFQWFSPDIGIPVKTAAEDGSWTMEYKNIKMGGQPDSLFEIPAGYNKMSMEMPSMDDIPVDMGY
jgi:hypothetical protein